MRQCHTVRTQAARSGLLALAATVALSGLAWAQEGTGDGGSLRAASLLFRHSVISPKYSPPKVETEWPDRKSVV